MSTKYVLLAALLMVGLIFAGQCGPAPPPEVITIIETVEVKPMPIETPEMVNEPLPTPVTTLEELSTLNFDCVIAVTTYGDSVANALFCE